MPRPKSQSIAPRGANTWRLTWELGPDPTTGKRRQRRETFHGTKTAAAKHWRTVQAELDQHPGQSAPATIPATPATSATLTAFWAQWIAALDPQQYSPNTLRQYQDAGRLHVLPRLGMLTLSQLTPMIIQHMLLALAQAPRQDGKPGTLSPTTIHGVAVILHTALAQAVEWDLLPANPCDRVKTPPTGHYQASIWDDATVQRFLQGTAHDPYGIAYCLALYAGLRRGEILGLRWADIDWDARTLTLTQQRVKAKGADGRYHDQFARLKSAHGYRTIACGAVLMDSLRDQQTRQDQDRTAAGDDYEDHGLVCQTAIGHPVSLRHLNRAFARAMRRLDAPHIHLHEMRHTHGTALFEAGVDLKTIADRMGHSQISTTAKLYLHPSITPQEKAAELLDRQWSQESPANGPSETVDDRGAAGHK